MVKKGRTVLAFMWWVCQQEGNPNREFTTKEIYETFKNYFFPTSIHASAHLQQLYHKGVVRIRREKIRDIKKSLKEAGMGGTKNYYSLNKRGHYLGRLYFLNSKEMEVDTTFLLWVNVKKKD